MTVTTALENLIKALDQFRDVDCVSKAIDDSIKVLGYDPAHPIQDYTVTLVLEIGAENMSDAIKQAVRMIDDNKAANWLYIVNDEDGKSAEIGGWEIS